MARSNQSYVEENTRLFRERTELVHAIAVLESSEDLSTKDLSQLRRLRSSLDMVTYELMEQNKGLVLSYARQFTRGSHQYQDDFISAGNTGLLKAINSFDPNNGARFAHWAYRSIQREILNEVHRTDFSTIGYSDFEKRPAVLKAKEALEEELDGQTPSVEDIADEAKVTVAQATRILNPPRNSSIDGKSGDDETALVVESIPDRSASVESMAIRAMDSEALARIAKKSLRERELFVIVRRFGLDGEPAQTLASIGEMLSLSRESVRNVQANAMAKLSHPAILQELVSSIGLAGDLAEAS